VAAQRARGQRGDDLVGVHVRRRARAGLEHVDGEVLVVLALGDLVGRARDRRGQVRLQHAEPGVHARGGRLQQAERANLSPFERPAGDGEVLHGALRLRAVQGVGGDPHLAHRVVFDPEFLLCHVPSLLLRRPCAPGVLAHVRVGGPAMFRRPHRGAVGTTIMGAAPTNGGKGGEPMGTTSDGIDVDVLIVGAGPTGLFAAYYAGFRGLSAAVVDSLPETGGQVTAMYPEKMIYDVAGFPAVRGRDLVDGL